jgi:hypothetical protein
VAQPIYLNFWSALGSRINRAYHFLRYLYFYRMLHRLNMSAISVRINLSELCAEEKDLRGIVDPQEKSDQGPAAPYAEPAAPLPR